LRPNSAVTEREAISAWRNGAHGTLLAMPRGLHGIVAAGCSGASCQRLMKSSVTCKGSVPSCTALRCSGHAAEHCLKRGDYARMNDFCVVTKIAEQSSVNPDAELE
jgi:hypothetical protein